jgi:PBP1b-binding outer membrane lipoprotein LpoB
MKFAKFGIFALAMGLFIASCGSSETTETETTDTAMTAPVEAAPVEPTPAPVDTMSAAPADSAATTTEAPAAH